MNFRHSFCERLLTTDTKFSSEDVLQATLRAAFRDSQLMQISEEDSLLTRLKAIAEKQIGQAIHRQTRESSGYGRNLERVRSSFSLDSVVDMYDVIASDTVESIENLARYDAIHHLQIALSKLPAECREVLRLRFMESMNRQEIARTTKKTDSAIIRLMSSAKRELQKHLRRVSNDLSER